MAEMTPLERSLLEDLEILLEDIIDADQHLNPETGEIYPSILDPLQEDHHHQRLLRSRSIPCNQSRSNEWTRRRRERGSVR